VSGCLSASPRRDKLGGVPRGMRPAEPPPPTPSAGAPPAGAWQEPKLGIESVDQWISGSVVEGAPTEEPRPDASNARSQRPATRAIGVSRALACVYGPRQYLPETALAALTNLPSEVLTLQKPSLAGETFPSPKLKPPTLYLPPSLSPRTFLGGAWWW
jgi:hypothetical protein